jgi:hypothetical protein
MPVVRFRVDRLRSIVPNLPDSTLEDVLFKLKCEVEYAEEGYGSIELNPEARYVLSRGYS